MTIYNTLKSLIIFTVGGLNPYFIKLMIQIGKMMIEQLTEKKNLKNKTFHDIEHYIILNYIL